MWLGTREEHARGNRSRGVAAPPDRCLGTQTAPGIKRCFRFWAQGISSGFVCVRPRRRQGIDHAGGMRRNLSVDAWEAGSSASPTGGWGEKLEVNR
jgi:hypothetical protein